MKKKRDSSKFWTKNQDCPSKSGTVGGYVIVLQLYQLYCIRLQVLLSHAQHLNKPLIKFRVQQSTASTCTYGDPLPIRVRRLGVDPVGDHDEVVAAKQRVDGGCVLLRN